MPATRKLSISCVHYLSAEWEVISTRFIDGHQGHSSACLLGSIYGCSCVPEKSSEGSSSGDKIDYVYITFPPHLLERVYSEPRLCETLSKRMRRGWGKWSRRKNGGERETRESKHTTYQDCLKKCAWQYYNMDHCAAWSLVTTAPSKLHEFKTSQLLNLTSLIWRAKGWLWLRTYTLGVGQIERCNFAALRTRTRDGCKCVLSQLLQ